ncbi:flagellar hook-length control protein FliK [Cupriavidus basilensis]
MIDISQIVSNAASTAASSRNANNTGGADAKPQGFGDALARARSEDRTSSNQSAGSNKCADSAPARADANGKDGAAADNGPAQATQASQGNAVAAKPSRRQDKEDEQGQEVAAGSAATSAAAALAALLAPQAAQPATPAANGAQTAAAGLPGTAALGTQAGLKDLTAPALATTAATTPDAAAPASSAAADTLATIASQRAALQPAPQTPASTQAAATDKPAATPASDAAKASPDLAASLAAAVAGQQAGKGQSGAGQQDTAGQPYKAQLQLGEASKDSKPQVAATAAPANPMQLAAAMRAAEPASTEAAPAGMAATPMMAASTMAASQAPTAGGLSPATSLPIAPPVGDGQWPQALGQQMVRLSTQGNHTAELQLNPPDLGPLKVVLNVVNDQAQAQFVSPHAAVRAAVEAALPQLRTALADNGIQLGQTSVGADSFAGQAGNGQQQQQRQPGGPQNGFGTLAGATAPVNAGPAAPVARTLARGEVDTFA